jgi:methanesulfonate monooxygenase subunit beta
LTTTSKKEATDVTIDTATGKDLDTVVRDLIYRSCLRLDEGDFAGWIDLCAPEFSYKITAYSPEIRREMVWLDHDREDMEGLFKMLPKHNSDHSPLTRHASVYTVEYDETRERASVITSLAVYRTQLDGGATSLFALGKYFDTVTLEDETPLLASRNVRLDTRELGIGSHLPL